MSGSVYEFRCRQVFNVFGAPGIPNTYEACLYRDGRRIKRVTSWRRRKVEQQCIVWRDLYDAVPKGDAPKPRPKVSGPCGRGVCAAGAGHAGNCDEASGWA
ncbi:hypothetical protein GS982_19975 [Rhodococcus hoagii]|nr:hypothetical protein [Prescottella equi]NKZ84481.1 hypothetical protein [Prescottella equi]